MVPTWPQHGPILGAKIEQKSVGRRCEKVSIFGWPSGSNLERFWKGFGSENGAMLAAKINPKMDVILEGPIPQITHETYYIFEDFGVGRGRSWPQNWAQDGSQNKVPNKMHLSIDFGSILIDFGTQVGVENGA